MSTFPLGFRTTLVFQGAREAVLSIDALMKGLDGGVAQAGRRLAAEGLETVVRLTPTQMHERPQKRHARPLKAGWVVKELEASKSRYEAIIENLASSTPAGKAVLGAVEFGSPPHEIRPVKARMLAWVRQQRQSLFVGRSRAENLDISDLRRGRRQAGGMVVVGKVDHPGMRGFRMLQLTRDHIDTVASSFLAAAGDEISKNWRRKATISVGVG